MCEREIDGQNCPYCGKMIKYDIVRDGGGSIVEISYPGDQMFCPHLGKSKTVVVDQNGKIFLPFDQEGKNKVALKKKRSFPSKKKP